MNVLELFAGIGGLSLGLERAGMRVVGHVEIDPFARAVLRKHWPEVPSHDDVRTALDWWKSRRRPRVDVVAGGYPCQPESTAGKHGGVADERWLWPEFARIVAALRPRWVIGENVLGHRKGGLRFVLRDLERLGYTATAGIIRACEVGAPHPRARLFVLAHATGKGRRPRRGVPGGRGTTGGQQTEPTGNGWWADEPDVGRVAYGVPGRVDRIRVLGNAVVPQVAEHIGRIVMNSAPVRSRS